jgi:EAL domain-containing protein (putative c-di-GMP-specific phosphodiesterase class I)
MRIADQSSIGSPSTAFGLDAAVGGTGLRFVFQPVVSLADRCIVGYEALARWPALGDPSPEAVFAHAHAVGAIDVLDELCIGTAITTAADHGLPADMTVFVNTEPTSTYVPTRDSDFLARRQFRVVAELTERSESRDIGEVVRKAEALRAAGLSVALDDFGIDAQSISLLNVVHPDVVKLDMRLVQDLSWPVRTEALDALAAYRNKANAVVVAEGIETPHHLSIAVALGATLGQGFLLGRPKPLHTPSAA